MGSLIKHFYDFGPFRLDSGKHRLLRNGQNGETNEYIETIPRIGYRFLAPVHEVRAESPPLVIEKHTVSQTVIEEELLSDQAEGTVEFERIVPIDRSAPF